MSEIVNLKIKKGTFYISSKTDDGKGYKETKVKNPSTGEELIRYHKKVSPRGYLNYINIKDDRFKGKVLSMLISSTEEEDTTYGIEIPIYGGAKKVKVISDYLKSIALTVPKLSKGDIITIFVNSKNKDKNGNLYRNLVILDEDDNLIKSEKSFTDAPSWDFTEKEDELGDKVKVWDATEYNKFFLDPLVKAIKSFSGESSNTDTKESNEAEKKEPATDNNTSSKPYTPVDVDDDDLPF